MATLSTKSNTQHPDKHNAEARDRDDVDKIITRITKHTPAAPYILSVPSDPPYRVASSQRDNWRKDTSFAHDEEYLQYQTFLWTDTSDTLLELRSTEEVESARGNISDKTHEAAASGRGTPLQSQVLKKKISLGAYASKTKSQSQTATPDRHAQSPLSSAKHGLASQRVMQPADNGGSDASDRLDGKALQVKDNPPTGTPQEGHDSNQIAPPAISHVASAPHKKESERQPDLPTESKGLSQSLQSRPGVNKATKPGSSLKPVESISQKASTLTAKKEHAVASQLEVPKTSRYKKGKLSDQANLLSGVPPLIIGYKRKLDLIDLPPALDSAKRLKSSIVEKSLKVLSSTSFSRDISDGFQHITIDFPSSFWPLSPGNRPNSDAQHSDQETNGARSDNDERARHMIVKLKFPKHGKTHAKAADTQLHTRLTSGPDNGSDRLSKRSLEESPTTRGDDRTNTKRPRQASAIRADEGVELDLSQDRERVKAISNTSQKSKPASAKDQSALYQPPQKREAREAVGNSRGDKGMRERAQESVRNTIETPQRALSPPSSRSVRRELVTPETDSRFRPSRVVGIEAETPSNTSPIARSAGFVDSAVSSTHGSVPSSSSNHWKDVYTKLSQLGKSLKTTSAASRDKGLHKLAALQSIESLSCYLLAFTAFERCQPRATRLSTWRSLLPYAQEMLYRTRDFPDLQGLSNLLNAVACFRVCDLYTAADAKTGIEAAEADKLFDVTKALHTAGRRANQLIPVEVLSAKYSKAASIAKSASPGAIMDPQRSSKFSMAMLMEWSSREKVEWRKQLNENICDELTE